MNLTQQGSYLFLALGDHFSATAQSSGLAIIDISNPAVPAVKSVYSFSMTSGSGHVAVQGNYAFLSAMQNGILVFDVSNKTNIQLVSQYKPSVHFPKVNPTSSEIAKINARMMYIKNNTGYLCYDAGGLRIINITNKNALVQTGKYSNPVLLNKPRAYNNLILDDSLVYVAADYAGMEVLKVKDTSNITQVGWWNPWAAGGTSNNWFNSPGHTNEIEYDKNCKMVFMSAGKSDIMAVSVANPAVPDSCSQFGTKVDSSGTWGIGHYQNQLYACYIVTGIPFYSNWSGVKIITYNNTCVSGIEEKTSTSFIKTYPNPANRQVYIEFSLNEKAMLKITDMTGRLLYTKELNAGEKSVQLNTEGYSDGVYFIQISSEKNSAYHKFILAKD
jgi:hypothetical protein